MTMQLQLKVLATTIEEIHRVFNTVGNKTENRVSKARQFPNRKEI